MRTDIMMDSAQKVFEEFFDFCREVLIDEDPKFLELIKNRYFECDEDFRQSEDMAVLLDETRCKMAAEKKRIFVHLKDLITSLKGKRKSKEALHLRKRKKDGRHLVDEDVKDCVVVLDNFQQWSPHACKSELVSNVSSPATVSPKKTCAVTDGCLQLAETILIADEAQREETFVLLTGAGGFKRECLRKNSFSAISVSQDRISKEDDSDKPKSHHIRILDFKTGCKDEKVSVCSSTKHASVENGTVETLHRVEDGPVQTPHRVEGGLVQSLCPVKEGPVEAPHPVEVDASPTRHQQAFNNTDRSSFQVPSSRKIKISKPVIIVECNRADAIIVPFYSKDLSCNHRKHVHSGMSAKKIIGHRETEYKYDFEVDGKECEGHTVKIECQLGLQNGCCDNSMNFRPDLPLKVVGKLASESSKSMKASMSVAVEECDSDDAVVLPLSSETGKSSQLHENPWSGFGNHLKHEKVNSSNVEKAEQVFEKSMDVKSEEELQCCCPSIIQDAKSCASSLSGTEKAAVVENHVEVDERQSDIVPTESDCVSNRDVTDLSPLSQCELDKSDNFESTPLVPNSLLETKNSPGSTTIMPNTSSETTNCLDSAALVPSTSADLKVNESVASEAEGSHHLSSSPSHDFQEEVLGQALTSVEVAPETNTSLLNGTQSGDEDSVSVDSHLAQIIHNTTVAGAHPRDEACVPSACKTKDLTVSGSKVNTKFSQREDKGVDSLTSVQLDKPHNMEVGKARRIPLISLAKIDGDRKSSKLAFMGSLSLHSKTTDIQSLQPKNSSDTDWLKKESSSKARLDSYHKSFPRPSTSKEDGGVLTPTEGGLSEDEFQAQSKKFCYTDKKPPADSVENRRVKKLETFLEKLRDEIEKCQTKELSLEDMDAEDSSYIYEDRLKKKFVACWSKLCELTKRTVTTGRPTEKKICYDGTRFKEINRRLEKFLNKRKIFPDFHDVKTIVKLTNKKYKLSLNHNKVCEIAREAFVDIGKMLQMRRHEDFIASFGSRQTDFQIRNPDPAVFDPTLKQRLEANRKVAKSNLENVITKYTEMQYSNQADSDSTSGEDEEEEDEMSKKAMSKEMDELVEEEEDDDDNAPFVGKRKKRMLDSDEEDNGDTKDVEPLDDGEDNLTSFAIEVDIASDDLVADFGHISGNKVQQREGDWHLGKACSSPQLLKMDDGDEMPALDLSPDGNMEVDVAQSSKGRRKSLDTPGSPMRAYASQLEGASNMQKKNDSLRDKMEFNENDLYSHKSVVKKASFFDTYGSIDKGDDGEDSDVQIIDSDDKDMDRIGSTKQVSPSHISKLGIEGEKVRRNKVDKHSMKTASSNKDLNKKGNSEEFPLSSHSVNSINGNSCLSPKASLNSKSEGETHVLLSSHRRSNAVNSKSELSPKDKIEGPVRDISDEVIAKDKSEHCSNIDSDSESRDIIISPLPPSKPLISNNHLSPNSERDSDNHCKVEFNNQMNVSSLSARCTDNKELRSKKKDDSLKSTSLTGSINPHSGPFEAENESSGGKDDLKIIDVEDSQEICPGGAGTEENSLNKDNGPIQSDGPGSEMLVILDVRTEADDASWNSDAQFGKTCMSGIESQLPLDKTGSSKSQPDKEPGGDCKDRSQVLHQEDFSGKWGKVSEASSESIEGMEEDVHPISLIKNQWKGAKIDSVHSCQFDSKISKLNENCVVTVDEDSPALNDIGEEDEKAESPADNALKSGYLDKKKDLGNNCDTDIDMSPSRDTPINKVSYESKRNERSNEEDAVPKDPEKGPLTDSGSGPGHLQIDKVFTIDPDNESGTGREKCRRSDISSYEVMQDKDGDNDELSQIQRACDTSETLGQSDLAAFCPSLQGTSETKVNADGTGESKISQMEGHEKRENGLIHSTEDESIIGENRSVSNEEKPDPCTKSSGPLFEPIAAGEEGDEEDIHDTVAKLCNAIITSDSDGSSALKEVDNRGTEEVEEEEEEASCADSRETSLERENEAEASKTGLANEQSMVDVEEGETSIATDVTEASSKSNRAVNLDGDEEEDNQENEENEEGSEKVGLVENALDEPQVSVPWKLALKETARDEVGKLLEEARQLGCGKKRKQFSSDENLQQSDTVRKRAKSKTNETATTADDDELEITLVEEGRVKRGRPPKSSNLSSTSNVKTVTARQIPTGTIKQFTTPVRHSVKAGQPVNRDRGNYYIKQEPRQVYVGPSSQKSDPSTKSSEKGINWTLINESIAHQLQQIQNVRQYPNQSLKGKGISNDSSTSHSRSYPQDFPKRGHLNTTSANRFGVPHPVVQRGRPSSVQSLRPRVPIPSLLQHSNTFSPSASSPRRPSHAKVQFPTPSGTRSFGKVLDSTPHSRSNQPARSLISGSQIQPHVKKKLDGCVMILDDSDEEDSSNTSNALKHSRMTSTSSKNISTLHSRRGRTEAKRKASPVESSTPRTLPKKSKTTSESTIVLSDSD